MVIDGKAVGQRMATRLIYDVFNALAADFAALDREAALASLARIEIAIADALAEFREKSPKGIIAYDDAFATVIETVSLLVEEARDAVQALGKPPTE